MFDVVDLIEDEAIDEQERQLNVGQGTWTEQELNRHVLRWAQ